MDTYVLRIYRRSTGVSQEIYGTLEQVGVKVRAAFASREELWALLAAPAAANHGSSEPLDGAEPDH